LATTIGRTPNAFAMRLSNFASVDPYHQERGIKGLVGGKKQVQPIWDEFVDNKEAIIFESEKCLASFENTTLSDKYENVLKGETKESGVKTRINQWYFRKMVLANYNSSCAITGINAEKFLIAGHILPWSKYKTERLNPQNGLCLNALHDKAFEFGFITIATDLKIQVCSSLLKSNKEFDKYYFHKYQEKDLILPSRFLPDIEFLKYHNQKKFSG
jgi:putative restriction endonuclease